jgi:hypothetical protein
MTQPRESWLRFALTLFAVIVGVFAITAFFIWLWPTMGF